MHFADSTPAAPPSDFLSETSLLTSLGLITGAVVLTVGIVAIVRGGQTGQVKKKKKSKKS